MHANMHCTAEAPPLRIARDWKPNYLVRWLFGQTTIWITAAGDMVEVESMDPEHALNTLCFLERVADDFPFRREALQSSALYRAIRQRVLDILVPPPPVLFEAAIMPADARPNTGLRRWAVYKLTDDGKVEWDAPLTESDARDLAVQRNNEAAQA